MSHIDSSIKSEQLDKAHNLSKEIIGASIEVHKTLGPGLIESIYEQCLRHELELRGYHVTQQQQITLDYKDLKIEHILRCDLIVENCLLLELKACETIHPIEKTKVITYLKLLNIPLALLINFHNTKLTDGVHRLINS